MSTKKCSKCGTQKDTVDFCKRKRSRDGLQSYCKVCSYESINAQDRKKRYSEYSMSKEGKYTHLKGSAKSRGLEFSITFEEFCELLDVSERCYYCEMTLAEVSSFVSDMNIDLKKKRAYGGSRGSFFTIDRLDSSVGYTNKNCVCACATCNLAKGHLIPADLFKEIAKRVIQNLKEANNE